MSAGSAARIELDVVALPVHIDLAVATGPATIGSALPIHIEPAAGSVLRWGIETAQMTIVQAVVHTAPDLVRRGLDLPQALYT